MNKRKSIYAGLIVSLVSSLIADDSVLDAPKLIPEEKLIISAIEDGVIEAPSLVKDAIYQYLSFLETQDAKTEVSYDVLHRITTEFEQYIPRKDLLLFYAKLDVIMSRYAPPSESDRQKMESIVSMKHRHLDWMEQYAEVQKGRQEAYRREFEDAALLYVKQLVLNQNIEYGRIEGLNIAAELLKNEYVHYPDRANIWRAFFIFMTPGLSKAERSEGLSHALKTLNVTDANKLDMIQLVGCAKSMVKSYHGKGKQDSEECKILDEFLCRVERSLPTFH